MVKAEDLPADLRRQLKRGQARTPRNQIRKTDVRAGHLPWICHTCQAEFPSWAATERHARDVRHPRIDLVLKALP